MHEVLVNCLGGLSLPRKSVVRLTDHPDMTLDVYRGRKTTNQQFPDSHFGSFYPQNFVLDPQKLTARVLSDAYTCMINAKLYLFNYGFIF